MQEKTQKGWSNAERKEGIPYGRVPGQPMLTKDLVTAIVIVSVRIQKEDAYK